MSETVYDAIVIGGGPAGSTSSTYLGRAGLRVLVLEKERFPRFHIGESLLPYSHAMFREMGLMPSLEAAGFHLKHGAQFHLGNGAKRLKLVFREGRYTREPVAFQVERSRFDHLLLQHAERSGAEVRQGITVTRFDNKHRDWVEVECKDESGALTRLRGRFLIDASGRANLTGNQQRIRRIHPRLRKVAIFSHFVGVRVDRGPEGGDTVIVRLADRWFWLIPLTSEKVSVGCVLDQDEFARLKRPADEVFWTSVESSKVMRDRMGDAKPLQDIQTTSDFSYTNLRWVDHRLIRVGDATGFLDPIFSAGVHLAMHSGKLAAEAIRDSVAAGHDGARLLAGYERRLRRQSRAYWTMAEGFYTTPFIEVLMEPRHRFNIPSAVTAVLGGELDGGPRVAWRLRVFFWIIKIQALWALLPRIDFSDPDERASSPAPAVAMKTAAE